MRIESPLFHYGWNILASGTKLALMYKVIFCARTAINLIIARFPNRVNAFLLQPYLALKQTFCPKFCIGKL